jgi:hypothetical protein
MSDQDLDHPLIQSAKKWLTEAIHGWLSSDQGKVVTLAPIAAEHLAKAALWMRNPVLLAELKPTHERPFLLLATGSELNDPGAANDWARHGAGAGRDCLRERPSDGPQSQEASDRVPRWCHPRWAVHQRDSPLRLSAPPP